MSANFEEILWRAHENFEEQNKVLESSTIIVNFCIIIIIIIICLWFRASLIYINNCQSRCNTKQCI